MAPTQWVQIPAGRFLMGSHASAKQVLEDFREYRRDIDEIIDEHPQHPVEITKPFFMAKTEVTVGQFRTFVEATGYKTHAELDGKGGWGGGWNSFPMWARSSFRNWNDIDTRCANLGLRVVAELSPLEIKQYEKNQPVRLLFVGDIMLDNGPGNAVNNGKDPFEKCAKLLLDADVTIGNLECVLGKGGKQVNKNYIFRGAGDSPKFLKKYFHALSLANNHTLDFGPDGLVECVDVLTKADIGFFGAGRNIQAARSGLMLDVKGRKIVLLGYNDFRKEDYQATEDRAGNMPLNSDWVIGGHPHVTQTIDSHRGRPIVYSLGNFVFDYYPVDPAIWYGWAIRLTIPPARSPQGAQSQEDVLIDWETITLEMDPQGLPHPVDPDE